MAEDVQLSDWSNETLPSSSFEGFYLSDLEYCVRTRHDHIWGLNEALASRK
jgi:carnitine monooxygenase subunit